MKKGLASFYEALNRLEVVGSLVSQERNRITSEVMAFRNRVDSISVGTLRSKNDEMGSFVESKLLAMKGKIAEWEKSFKKAAETESFQEGLRNKFIVVVYGEVNSGKSSLGNFVAKNYEGSIEFKKYITKSGEPRLVSLESKEFETDSMECTKDVQLFELGGMAWVDLPGILSTTKEMVI